MVVVKNHILNISKIKCLSIRSSLMQLARFTRRKSFNTFWLIHIVRAPSMAHGFDAVLEHRTTARSRSGACSAPPALKCRALPGRIVVPGISTAHFWLRQKRREQPAVERNTF
jgi:hypothetical protein